MPGLTTMGSKSKTIMLTHENHKQTISVEASVDLMVGQHVKLTADGRLAIWTKADAIHLNIGVVVVPESIYKGNPLIGAGEEATVWCRGFAIQMGISNASQNAGPVTIEGMGSTTLADYVKFSAAASDATTCGWALDNATAANELIRVLVRD